MRRRNTVIVLAIGLWSMSALCVVAAAVIAGTAVLVGETELDFARARVIALALGFLPWIFTFCVTRVLYGVETLLEK